MLLNYHNDTTGIADVWEKLIHSEVKFNDLIEDKAFFPMEVAGNDFEELIKEYNIILELDILLFYWNDGEKGLIMYYDFINDYFNMVELEPFSRVNFPNLANEIIVKRLFKRIGRKLPQKIISTGITTVEKTHCLMVGGNEEKREYPDTHHVILRLACKHLVKLLSLQHYQERQTDYQSNLALLVEANQLINSGDNYEIILSKVIKKLSENVQAENGGILLYEPEDEQLVLQKPAFGITDEKIINNYRVDLDKGGVAARVFTSGQPYLSNDAPSDPQYLQEFIKTFGVRNTISVPLQISERTIGVVHLINKKEGEFTKNDVRLLFILASQLAGLLEKTRMLDSIKRQERETKTLYEIGLELSSKMFDLDRLLQSVVTKACSLLDCEMAMLVVNKDDSYSIQAIHGFNVDDLVNSKVNIESWIWDRVLEQPPQPFILDSDINKCESSLGASASVNGLGFILKLREYQTVIAVPLGNNHDKGGLLLCCHRGKKEFTVQQVNLLSRLSNQVSIAIEKARLYEHKEKTVKELREFNAIIEKQSWMLRKSLDIHNELTKIVINNHGIQAVADTLSSLVGSPVMVLDQFFRRTVFANQDNIAINKAYFEKKTIQRVLQKKETKKILNDIVQMRQPKVIPAYPHEDLTSPSLFAPIVINGNIEGYVVMVMGQAEPKELDVVAIEHSASVFALELIKEKIAYKVDKKVKADYLHELLSGNDQSDEEILKKAEILGCNLQAFNYQVVVMEVKKNNSTLDNAQADQISEIVDGHVQKLSSYSIVVTRGGLIVILNCLSEELIQPHKLVTNIRTKLQTFAPDLDVFAGLGCEVSKPADFARSFNEAKYAVKIVQRSSKMDPIASYAELGIFTLLGKVGNKQELQDFIERSLEPLISYDADKGTDFTATLECFLYNGCNTQQTARELFLHVNTLKYRIQRIREILDVDFKEAKDRLQLELAFKIREMLEA